MSMIKVESIADGVKKYLEQRIFTGKLKPGQQIKEQEVAESLGVSRPPIREALKILEAEGLITRKPNKGAFVTEIEEKDIWEIYTLKMGLYDLATRLAFNKISDREIERWDELIRQMGECVVKQPADLLKYQTLNEGFHGIMIDLCANERLKRMLLILHNQVKRYSYKSLGNKEHLQESFNYHRAILEAIKNKDKALTIKLTREHVLKGLNVLQELMAEEGKSTESNDQNFSLKG